jgi:hypothetical protein
LFNKKGCIVAKPCNNATIDMSDATDPMPTKAIERALEVIRRRVSEAETECAALRERIAVDHEEERLLARILSIRRGEAIQNTHAVAISEIAARHSDPRPAATLLQAVLEELNSAGRPLHISDLMRVLALRKVDIPGAGTQANLITYLRRDPRFVRASRGVYALAEWGIDAMPPTRRRKRRKRARSSAT